MLKESLCPWRSYLWEQKGQGKLSLQEVIFKDQDIWLQQLGHLSIWRESLVSFQKSQDKLLRPKGKIKLI